MCLNIQNVIKMNGNSVAELFLFLHIRACFKEAIGATIGKLLKKLLLTFSKRPAFCLYAEWRIKITFNMLLCLLCVECQKPFEKKNLLLVDESFICRRINQNIFDFVLCVF